MTLKNINKRIYLYITLGLFFVKVISSHYIFVKKILSFISEYISSSLLGDVWESPCALWELPLCGRSGMFVRKWANKSRKCLFAQIVCTKYIICCIWDPCMCILALLEIKGVEHWLHWANNIKAKALEAQKPCFVSNFSMSVWTSPFCRLFSPSHVRLMFHVSIINRPFFIYWPWNWIWKTNQCIKYISYRMWVDLWNLFSSDSVLCNSEWYHL